MFHEIQSFLCILIATSIFVKLKNSIIKFLFKFFEDEMFSKIIYLFFISLFIINIIEWLIFFSSRILNFIERKRKKKIFVQNYFDYIMNNSLSSFLLFHLFILSLIAIPCMIFMEHM